MRSRWAALIAVAVICSACGGSGGGENGDDENEDANARTPRPVFFVASGNTQLVAVADDGSAAPVVLSDGVDFTNAGFPNGTPSPDGSKILMRGQAMGDPIVHNYVRNADGSGLRRVSSVVNPNAQVFQARWSPDGSQLAYIADGDTADKFELYLVNADGSNHRKISLAIGSNEDTGLSFSPWSPDGRYIAYTVINGANSSNSDVAVYDTVNMTNAVVPSSGLPESPKWAPDGRKIAYKRLSLDSDNNPAYQVYILDPDGSNHRVANGGLSSTTYLANYAWSPDSRYLAELFQHRREFGIRRPKLFINTFDTEDTDGMPPNPSVRVHDFFTLTQGTEVYNTDDCASACSFYWSQTGTELAYTSDAATRDFVELYTYNIASQTTVPIDHGISNAGMPGIPPSDVRSVRGWSSDDRYLIYTGGYTGFSARLTGIADNTTGNGSLFTDSVSGTPIVLGGCSWNRLHTAFYYTHFDSASMFAVYVRKMSAPYTPVRFDSTLVDTSQQSAGELYLTGDEARLIIDAEDRVNNKGILRSLDLNDGSLIRIDAGYDVDNLLPY